MRTIQIPGQPASPPPDETEAGAEEAQRQAVQSALQTSATHIESFRRELQRRVEPVQLGTDMVSVQYFPVHEEPVDEC